MRALTTGLVLAVTALTFGLLERNATASVPGHTLRVATFNIHKGAERRGRYDLAQTIDAIAALDADLVGAQEVMRNHVWADCDDQPARIAEGLRDRTGRPWTYVHADSWFTGDRGCLDAGRGDRAGTEGLAFFTPHRILSSATVRLSHWRIGLAVRLAAMPDVPVIVTHLEAGRQSAEARAGQLAMLLAWASRHGPGLLIGDLNAGADAAELLPALERYADAWTEAAGRGAVRGVTSGATRPGRRGSRIDYVLVSPAAPLRIESVEVVETDVSDHYPVIATFTRAERAAPEGSASRTGSR